VAVALAGQSPPALQRVVVLVPFRTGVDVLELFAVDVLNPIVPKRSPVFYLWLWREVSSECSWVGLSYGG